MHDHKPQAPLFKQVCLVVAAVPPAALCMCCCPCQARTIDLCNNPKTKEPKLQAARRIIKEWPDLDKEQAEFTASVDAQYKAKEEQFAAAGVEAPGVGDDDAAAADAAQAGQDPTTSDHTEL